MDLLEELAAERDIRKALGRYARCADDLDADGWVNMFTPDGSVIVGTKQVCGHAELRAWIKTIHSGPKFRHLMANADITLETPTTATMVVDMALLRADGRRWTLVAAPRYSDRLVKTDAGWKFQERRLDVRAP